MDLSAHKIVFGTLDAYRLRRPATARERQQFDAADGRLDIGLCPNRCGALEKTSDFTANCPKCHFHYQSNVPLEF